MVHYWHMNLFNKNSHLNRFIFDTFFLKLIFINVKTHKIQGKGIVIKWHNKVHLNNLLLQIEFL